MNENILEIEGFNFTGNIEHDAYCLLKYYNCLKTIEHSKDVAEQALILANDFNINNNKVNIASVLHDISAFIPNKKRLEYAEKIGLEILDEERQFPILLHQKISKVIAKELFKVEDEDILSAIECHTTLKSHPTKIDLIVFIADKIRWDQEGIPPYLYNVEEGLKVSLEIGALCYIDFLLNKSSTFKIAHPWLLEAYTYLKKDHCL